MNIINNEISFQARISNNNIIKNKRLEAINRAFAQLTSDSEGNLQIKHLKNDKIQFSINNTNQNNIQIGFAKFRKDLSDLSDFELAEKFSKYYKIMNDAKNIVNLENYISDLLNIQNRTKEVIKNLKERNMTKFAQQYENFVNINDKRLSTLKTKLTTLTNNFYKDKEESSQLYPEINQVELL